MKPHYVLYKGRPERVGLLQGKKVILVKVEPVMHEDGSQYCHQCLFAASSCATLATSQEVLGADCTQSKDSVYKEVP